MTSSLSTSRPRTFRLSRLAYIAVLFVTMCTIPVALIGTDGTNSPGLTWRVALLLVPIAAAVYVARTSTRVSRSGIEVRALLGTRRLRWDDLRGLAVVERGVYAVTSDGESVRLPCVQVSGLHDVTEASGGRLPPVDAPTRKYAPSKRTRRRMVRRGTR